MDTPGFLTEPPADADVEAAHQADVDHEGYVANWTRLWCWQPDILAKFTALRSDLLAATTLSPREVAVLVTATASTLGDSYCSLAWGRKLADLSDAETAAGVIEGADAGLSEREAALAHWARRLVSDPNSSTAEDVETLRQVGFDEREIFDATAWVGFRLGFSTINDALGAQPDAELRELVPERVLEAVTFGRSR